MVFGLGTTEILLVAALVLAMIGPKGVKQIKPFFKSMYKAYLQYQDKVRAGQQEFNDITGEFQKELEAVKAEAEKELRPEIDKMRQEIEASRKEMEQEQQGLMNKVRSFHQDFRQEFDQAKQENRGKPAAVLAQNRGFGRGITSLAAAGKYRQQPQLPQAASFSQDKEKSDFSEISIRTKPDDLSPLKPSAKKVPQKNTRKIISTPLTKSAVSSGIKSTVRIKSTLSNRDVNKNKQNSLGKVATPEKKQPDLKKPAAAVPPRQGKKPLKPADKPSHLKTQPIKKEKLNAQQNKQKEEKKTKK